MRRGMLKFIFGWRHLLRHKNNFEYLLSKEKNGGYAKYFWNIF